MVEPGCRHRACIHLTLQKVLLTRTQWRGLRAQAVQSERPQPKLVALYHFGIIDLGESVESVRPFTLRNGQKCQHKTFCRWLQGAHGHSLLPFLGFPACEPSEPRPPLRSGVVRQMGGADGRSTEINANIQSPDIVRPHAPFPT